MVIQSGHLPDFDDEPSLPIITAIVKEAMRWKVVAPIGSCIPLSSDLVFLTETLISHPSIPRV